MKERRLLEQSCWELRIRLPKKGVWRLTKKKKERSKCAFIMAKRRWKTVWKEDNTEETRRHYTLCLIPPLPSYRLLTVLIK